MKTRHLKNSLPATQYPFIYLLNLDGEKLITVFLSFPYSKYKILRYILKTNIVNSIKSKENNQNSKDEHGCTI